MRKRILFLLLVLVLTGCVSNSSRDEMLKTEPGMVSEYDSAHFKGKKIGKDSSLAISYLARHVMNMEERDEFSDEMNEIVREKRNRHEGQASQGSLVLGMGASAATTDSVGNASAYSLGFDLLGFGMGFLMGPSLINAEPYVGQFFLTNDMLPEGVNTKEGVTEFAYSMLINRFEKTANNLEGQFECIEGCDKLAVSNRIVRTFVIRDINPILIKQKLGPEALYHPKEIYFTLIMMPLIPAFTDTKRDEILGFKPDWQSLPNGLYLHGSNGFFYDENGSKKVLHVSGYNYEGVHALNWPIAALMVGRYFRTEIFDNPYMIYIDTKLSGAGVNIVSYNGKQYMFKYSSRNKAPFVRYELIKPY